MSDIRFNNKTVVVTGGGTGIGYAIAKSFLNCGANVAIIGRRKNILDASVRKMKNEIFNSEENIISLKYDLSKEKSVDEMFNKVIDHYNGIDILVNNSASWVINPVSKLSNFEIDDQFSNIFKTTIFCTKYASKNMNRGGVIINIGSFAGILPIKYSSIYSSLKSAICTFTKSAAAELGKDSIRVNCVIPGVIRTPMTSKYIDENYDKLIKPIALGKFGTCSDIANGVLFLSSDLAKYITGAILEITGGKFTSQL